MKKLSLILCTAIFFASCTTLHAMENAGPSKEPATHQANLALCKAAYKGNLAQLQESIKRGADVNFRDSKNNTPLLYAVTRKHPDCVTALLAHGAKTDEKNEYGTTLLMHAARYGEKPHCPQALLCLQALLEHGAEVDLHNDDGRTALMGAAQFNKTDRIKAILAKDILNLSPTDAKAYIKKLLEQTDNYDNTAHCCAKMYGPRPTQELTELLDLSNIDATYEKLLAEERKKAQTQTKTRKTKRQRTRK